MASIFSRYSARNPGCLALLVLFAAMFAGGGPALAQQPDRLAELIAGKQRSPGNVARDVYRNPWEALKFLGLADTSRVVEALPGSGAYWTEIIAPWVKDKGLYIAAGRDPTVPPQYLEDHRRMLAKYAADPATFGKVEVRPFVSDKYEVADAGSADFVLTFRNMHNWIDRDELTGALKVFFRALKPGGIFGVADHRGPPDASMESLMKSGYVRQDMAIALIEKAGFRLIGTSEVKANPKDTKNYPEGVWTLPPTYRLGDVDRAKYAAIGESDRFLLKFLRP